MKDIKFSDEPKRFVPLKFNDFVRWSAADMTMVRQLIGTLHITAGRSITFHKARFVITLPMQSALSLSATNVLMKSNS